MGSALEYSVADNIADLQAAADPKSPDIVPAACSVAVLAFADCSTAEVCFAGCNTAGVPQTAADHSTVDWQIAGLDRLAQVPAGYMAMAACSAVGMRWLRWLAVLHLLAPPYFAAVNHLKG